MKKRFLPVFIFSNQKSPQRSKIKSLSAGMFFIEKCQINKIRERVDNKYENDTHHTTPIVRQRNPLLSPQKSIIVPILPVYPHHVLGASCEPKRQCVRNLLCFRFMHRQIFQFNNDRKGQPPVQVENAGAGAIRFVKLQPGVHSHPKTSIRAEQIVTPIAVKQCGRKCFQVIGGGLRQGCFLQITRKRFSRSRFLKSERFQRLNDLASNQSSFDFELQTRRLDITTQITIPADAHLVTVRHPADMHMIMAKTGCVQINTVHPPGRINTVESRKVHPQDREDFFQREIASQEFPLVPCSRQIV